MPKCVFDVIPLRYVALLDLYYRCEEIVPLGMSGGTVKLNFAEMERILRRAKVKRRHWERIEDELRMILGIIRGIEDRKELSFGEKDLAALRGDAVVDEVTDG